MSASLSSLLLNPFTATGTDMLLDGLINLIVVLNYY